MVRASNWEGKMRGFAKGAVVVLLALFIAAWPIGGGILGSMFFGQEGGVFGLLTGIVIAGGFIGLILEIT